MKMKPETKIKRRSASALKAARSEKLRKTWQAEEIAKGVAKGLKKELDLLMAETAELFEEPEEPEMILANTLPPDLEAVLSALIHYQTAAYGQTTNQRLLRQRDLELIRFLCGEAADAPVKPAKPKPAPAFKSGSIFNTH